MCGIIGGIRADGVLCRLLVNGLSHLEYRGYDSAGIALSNGDEARRLVAVGRVGKLRQGIAAFGDGKQGIGHTRWATHGAPSENNAHPIRAGRVLVVHNGIIENHQALRDELRNAGRRFDSETDTEVIAHLLDIALSESGDLTTAWRSVHRRLHGAYAVVAMADGIGEIICARHGSPLLVGIGDGGVYVASDTQALLGIAQKVHYFEEGEYGKLSEGTATFWDSEDNAVEANWNALTAMPADMQLGEYRHFMQKEIFAQPDAVAATMERYVAAPSLSLRRFGGGATGAFRRLRQVTIIACGTSYHAGLVARYWLERFGVPCRVEIASEYRYRPDPLAATSLVVGVSQSGETADTLSAMRAAGAAGATRVAVVNRENSSMLREAEFSFYTRAGMEVGVAATKSFTTQLVALLLLTLAIAKARRLLTEEDEAAILQSLRRLPYLISKALLLDGDIKQWAEELTTAKSAVYIGRRGHYPLALEGALKLKEISYIHAEGIAAGELKHGSLALVDSDLPVVGLAADDDLHDKMLANLSEVAARKGRLYVLAGQRFSMDGVNILRLEEDGGDFLSPIVYAVPLQLLAYHTARLKGTDVDKPRNLAKSVTVE